MTIETETPEEVVETVETAEQPEDFNPPDANGFVDPDLARLQDAIKENADLDAAGTGEVVKPEAEVKPPVETPKPEVVKPAAGIPRERLNQVLEEKRTANDQAAYDRAQKDLLLQLAATGALTPELAKQLQQGGSLVKDEGGTGEPADPHAALDAEALDAAQKFEDGDINLVEKTRLDLAIGSKRRKLDNEIAEHRVNAQLRNQSDQDLVEYNKGLHADFPIIAKLEQRHVDAARPAATLITEDELAKEGAVYNPLNKEHVKLYRFNLATTLDKQFGEGKGPLSKQGKPTPAAAAKPGATPSNVVALPRGGAGTPFEKLQVAAKQPPDTSTFANSLDTETAKVVNDIPSMTTEQIAELQKTNPALVKSIMEG